MSKEESTYIAHCSFCKDGMLRFMRCNACDGICAICDECELIWKDIAVVHKSPDAHSDSSHPNCPHCESKTTWTEVDSSELENADLSQYVSGKSE